MAKYYNGTHYILDEENHQVVLMDNFQEQLLGSNKFLKFKKLGGSSISNILTPDRFNSEFKAFCHIARLALPVLQKKYVNAGQILEPKIIENLQEFYNKKLLKNTIIKHIEAKDVDYDYFKNLDIIGGVPDALAENEKIVFEIKTTNIKNYDSWTLNNQANKLKKDGVPLNYKKQAQLYASLLGYDSYIIVGCFLNDDDYANPEDVNVAKRKIEVFHYSLKNNPDLQMQIKDDIQKIIEFHKRYSVYKEKKSPKYDLINDKDQIDYLRCKNENERRELFNKWKQMGKIDDDIPFESF